MFSPFLLDFFVNTTDPVFIRRLKLEILTCIATETNISTILSELNVCYTLHHLFLANSLSLSLSLSLSIYLYLYLCADM